MNTVAKATQDALVPTPRSATEGQTYDDDRSKDKLLADTRAKLDSTSAVVGEKTRRAADATHAYVKDNPWRTAGVAALAGAIIGFLLSRR